jgi:hypothetical protein
MKPAKLVIQKPSHNPLLYGERLTTVELPLSIRLYKDNSRDSRGCNLTTPPRLSYRLL